MYRKTFRFLQEDLKNYVKGTAIAFVIIAVVTLLVCIATEDKTAVMLDPEGPFMQQIETFAPDGKISATLLFINNLEACVTAVAFGIVPMVFLTVVTIAFNALLIGATLELVHAAGYSVVKTFILGMLPHGIFEFTAMFLSMALGLYICHCINLRIRKREACRGIVKEAVTEGARVFFLLVIPLLIIAALVEANISPLLMERFVTL